MKPVRIYMYKDGGNLKMMPGHAEIYNAWVSRVSDDKTVQCTLKINKLMKTLPQLGYYHAVMIPVTVEGLIDLGYDTIPGAELFGDLVEEQTNPTTVDDYFKKLFAKYKGLKKTPSKAKMTVDEFSEFINFILKWLAEKPGIYCPPPKKNEQTKTLGK